MVIELTEQECQLLKKAKNQSKPLAEKESYGSAIEAVRTANTVARDDNGEYSTSLDFVIFNGKRMLLKKKIWLGADEPEFQFWVQK